MKCLSLPVQTLERGSQDLERLTANGKTDIRQMFSSRSTFDISGSVRPSAAVEVTGETGVRYFIIHYVALAVINYGAKFQLSRVSCYRVSVGLKLLLLLLSVMEKCH